MAGGGKRRAAKLEEDGDEEDESRRPNSKSATESFGSDDEEANEDLSLKVVEKALLTRAAMLAENEGAVFDEFRVARNDIELPSSSSQETEVAVAGSSGFEGEAAGDLKIKKKARKKKKTKIEKVIIEKDEENVATEENPEPVEEANVNVAKVTEAVVSLESNAVNTSDNVVLRKLLRGPRYFDPPDSGWATCYNCGEEGHMAVNCASASRRKKPCFICGSLDHNARQCSKAQDCYICRKGGHRSKDCPESFKISKNVKICLRCGDSGHDMFSCRKEYACDDLKEIQCYVCKDFGHLCCAKYVDTIPREVSCYKCGQLGHIGMACGKPQGQNNEIIGLGSHNVCYRCGEEGHFARECQSSSKVSKRNREPSTPSSRPHSENKKYLQFNSAPNNYGKDLKMKKTKHEEKGMSTPRKPKQRGGWITEDPEEFSNKKSKKSHWSYPRTPYEHHGIPNINFGGHISRSQPSQRFFSHQFSASRFGNPGSSEVRRAYNWW